MLWMDYTIESIGNGEAFRVKGEWPGEVMGVGPKGDTREHWLYKPGDIFVVDENGWLRKTDEVNTLLIKYEQGMKNDCDRIQTKC